jgi:hypothetical protein
VLVVRIVIKVTMSCVKWPCLVEEGDRPLWVDSATERPLSVPSLYGRCWPVLRLMRSRIADGAGNVCI